MAKNKNSHTIAEELIIHAAKVMVKHVIGNEAVSKLNSASVSNNTIQRRITETSTDIKEQVITEVQGQNRDLPYNWSNQPTCQTTHSFWSMCVMLLKIQFEVNYY